VWVSEIMAQQTRIETMLPYYARWMEKWPDIGILAQADEIDVLKMWEGLGYYTRARNLHKGAKTIVVDYQGVFPSTLDEIRKIPGIGPYTAAAIASIVFDAKVPAIDGNVMRVVARLLVIDAKITTATAKAIVLDAMTMWIKDATPHLFTQAMMELGALICTPKSPDCKRCPLLSLCLGYHSGNPDRYPLKKAKVKIPTEYYDCFILHDGNGNTALTDQSDDGLMKGYYRFPVLSQLQGITIQQSRLLGVQKHVYSHKIWETRYFGAQVDPNQNDFLWVDETQLAKLPLIGAHRKFHLLLKPE
jgi:A/G-specific adenine glycosylase